MQLPDHRSMPPSRMLARQQRLERHVAEPGRRRWATRTTTRTVAIAVGASALLLGGTAGAYVAFKPATVPVADGTRCYSKATLDGGDDFYGTTVIQAFRADGTRNAATAIDACSGLWKQGFLKPGQKEVGRPANGEDHPVPHLVACTLDNGMAAVFPGDDGTCAKLGLPRLAE